MKRETTLLTALLAIVAGDPAHGQQLPVLRATEDLSIAGAPSGFTAGDVNIRVATNGTIALHEVLTQPVILVSNDGKHLETINRTGDNPGEFLDVRWLGWAGDSLWIADPALQRITLFTPERKVAMTVPIPTLIAGPSGTIPVQLTSRGGCSPCVAAVYSDGGMLVMSDQLPMGMPRQAGLGLIHLAHDGQFVAVMGGTGEAPKECYTPFSIQSSRITYPLGLRRLFCAPPGNAVSPDGRSLLTIRDVAATNDSGAFIATRVNALGDTIYQRRYAFGAVPVSEQEADSAVALWVARSKSLSPLSAADLERMRQAYVTSMPRMHSPVAKTVMGDDGTAWLELFARDSASRWALLDPKGEPIGIVTMPANVRLAAVSREGAWGSEVLPHDQVNVVRFTVTKTSP